MFLSVISLSQLLYRIGQYFGSGPKFLKKFYCPFRVQKLCSYGMFLSVISLSPVIVQNRSIFWKWAKIFKKILLSISGPEIMQLWYVFISDQFESSYCTE